MINMMIYRMKKRVDLNEFTTLNYEKTYWPKINKNFRWNSWTQQLTYVACVNVPAHSQ